MNTQYIKYLSKDGVEDTKFYIAIDPSKFPSPDSNEVRPKKINERKLNIRIQQHDLYMLDAVAKYHGMSRSALINELLHDFLLEELDSIKEGDARALLANTIDERVNYDKSAVPWIYSALSHDFESLLDNIITYNSPVELCPDPHYPEAQFNSDTFCSLSKKIKGVKK